jgi:hypothetical protein
MIKISVLLLLILSFFFTGCNKNNKEEYIQIYFDMADQLSKYVKIFQEIKKEQAVSLENHKNVLKIQDQINIIHARVKSFPESLDNDTEIREKLKDTLIKIELYHVYIIKLQNEIKNIAGTEALFNELKKRGID